MQTTNSDNNETLVLMIDMLLYALAPGIIAHNTPRRGIIRLGWTGQGGRARSCEVEGEPLLSYLRDRRPDDHQLIAVPACRARRKKQQPTNTNNAQDH